MRRINHCLLIATAALGISLFAAQSAQAQTNGPAGSFTNFVSGSSNLVWDFQGVITNVSLDITNTLGTEVFIGYPVAILQFGNGRILGLGDTIVELDTPDTNTTFTGTYRINGAISSNKGRGRALVHSVVKGLAELSDRHNHVALRRVTANQVVHVTLDNTALTLEGTQSSSAAASGVGGIRGTDSFGPDSLPAFVNGDGTWSLALIGLVTDSKNKITGTATVTLDSGQTFTYVVKGLFKSKTNTSKLVLTGFDLTTKGSVLVVSMTGNSVTSIKGKISGQSVNVVYP